MTFEEICSHFKKFEKPYPREAVEEALQRREELVPWVISEWSRIVADPTQELEDNWSTECYYLLVFALYLGITETHNSLLRFARLPEDEIDYLIGDSITEDLWYAFYATCGDNYSQIIDLVFDSSACEYCRQAALDALNAALCEGRLAREQLIDIYRVLLNRFISSDCNGTDKDFFPMVGVTLLDICPTELQNDLEYLIDKELVDSFSFDKYDLDESIAEGEQESLTVLRNKLEQRRNRSIHDELEWLGRSYEDEDGDDDWVFDPNSEYPVPDYDDDLSSLDYASSDSQITAFTKQERKAKKKKRKAQKAARKKNRKK